MPDRQATNGDAVDFIENDGLAYAVRHYCDGAYFKDPVTTLLWNQAASALDALVEYLQKETGRDVN